MIHARGHGWQRRCGRIVCWRPWVTGSEEAQRQRLRALLRKREKRPGFARAARDHRRWPNAFFAEHGLFTLHEAHALASQSR